ncbi:MAG: hypothetical protein RIS54_623 [Verrucomicrobiota bacterium]|jgi:uncharacterized OsmC-like protein
MVKSTGIYRGGLNCELTHGPSGQVIATDAPVDNQGRGQAFSPTDLAAAALASCIVTTMAIAARSRLGFDLPEVKWEVTKEMSTDAPRRIIRIRTEVWIPLPRSQDPDGVLERVALGCPVHRSLHPDLDKPIVFHWAD